MKVWKKLSAVALALVMVMALSATAFANEPENMDGESGKIGEFNRTADTNNAPTAKDNAVKIYKELTVFNPSATSINAPTISYSYAIEAGSAGKNISDGAASVVTYAGIVDDSKPTITSTVSWSPAETVTAASVANHGFANRKPITIDFEGVTFPRAGVYRYKITETIASAAYTAAGVVDGDISNTRYLDVYVNDDGIYGYVLLVADNDVNDDTAKTEGFVAYGTGGSAQTADQYHTFNLTISKTVTNDNYTKTTHHQFPFTVTFTNSAVTGAVKPIITATDYATLAQGDAAAIASFSSTNPTIADSASVTYTGIPMGTAIGIVEKNDVAGTTYAVTTNGADTDITTAENVTSNNSTTGTISITAQTAGSEADKTVAVTNNMLIISPTGVTLRYAPYLAMMGAGVVALPLSLRKKEEEL